MTPNRVEKIASRRSALAVQLYVFWTCCRPRSPRDFISARAGAIIFRASLNDTTDSGSKLHPAPVLRSALLPPTSDARNGTAHAIASSTAFDIVSYRLGITNRSI